MAGFESMLTLLGNIFTVLAALGIFIFKAKRSVLIINALLCFLMSLVLLLLELYQGMTVTAAAFIGSTLRLAVGRDLSRRETLLSLFILVPIAASPLFFQLRSLLDLVPIIAFGLFRYSEFRLRDKAFRVGMIMGSGIFCGYCVLGSAWGVALAEGMFALGHFFQLIKLLGKEKAVKIS